MGKSEYWFPGSEYQVIFLLQLSTITTLITVRNPAAYSALGGSDINSSRRKSWTYFIRNLNSTCGVLAAIPLAGLFAEVFNIFTSSSSSDSGSSSNAKKQYMNIFVQGQSVYHIRVTQSYKKMGHFLTWKHTYHCQFSRTGVPLRGFRINKCRRK